MGLNIHQVCRVRKEAKFFALSTTFTKDLLASGFVFSHLHAYSLYVPDVFVFFEPSASIISSMTIMGNFVGFEVMDKNLSQMKICKRLESHA